MTVRSNKTRVKHGKTVRLFRYLMKKSRVASHENRIIRLKKKKKKNRVMDRQTETVDNENDFDSGVLY